MKNIKKIKIRLSGIYFYKTDAHCYYKLTFKGFKFGKKRISKANYLKV